MTPTDQPSAASAIGDLHAAHDDRTEADDQEVAALAQDLGLADRDRRRLDRRAGRSPSRAGSAARTDGPGRRPCASAGAAPARPWARRRRGSGSWRCAGIVNMPWWLVPSSPTSPARSTPITTGCVVLAHVVDGLVERALQERRVERHERPHAAERKAGGERHACCSEMPTSYMRPGNAAWNLARPVPVGMPAVIATMRSSFVAERDELLGHDRGVVRRLRACRDGLGHRRRGVAVAALDRSLATARPSAAAGHDRHRRQCRSVEADLVGHGRLVATALLGADVDDDRSVHVAQRAGAGRALSARRLWPGMGPT